MEWPGSTGHPVAAEELASLVEQPGELERSLELGQAHGEAGALAAGELRRVGHEQLVDEAGVDQLGVDTGPALAEDGADPALRAQVAERRGEVDLAVVADHAHRRLRLGRLGLRGGEDQDAAAAVGEERSVPGNV